MADILQAFEWMKEGKKVKHSNWVDGSHMYYSSDTYDFRNSRGRPFEISPGDFTAEWEVFEEKPKNLSDKIDFTSKLGDAVPVQDIKKSVNELKQRIPKIWHPTEGHTMFGYLEQEMLWKEINLVFGDALSEDKE